MVRSNSKLDTKNLSGRRAQAIKYLLETSLMTINKIYLLRLTNIRGKIVLIAVRVVNENENKTKTISEKERNN